MSRPITIVHYWAGCPKSQNSKWQRFLATIQRCHEQGWMNYLVWSRMPENPALVEPFREAGCEIIIQRRSRGNLDFTSAWRTYKLLRRLNCDIFHCHNDHTSPLIGAALAGIPVRIWSKLAMSPYYEERVSAKGLHRLMVSTRASCLCAHRILAISDRVGRELIDTAGFGKKIDTVYVPVDYHRFANAAKGNIRQELGFDQSHVIITSVGRAIPVKGWDIAVRAFAKVHDVILNARLVFIGSTTSSEETRFFQQLTDLIKHYKLSKYVYFLGHRDDIPKILKASDVFILPSRSEGLCLALIEAMAARLPCVAARVGGVPEVIHHKENGLLFERESVEELADHMERLIEDRSLRTKIATQATERARTFNTQIYVDKIFECYRSLLNSC